LNEEPHIAMKNQTDPNLIEAMPFRWGASSSVGRVRERNEDAFFLEPEIGLFIVADGMGGHKGGALASKIVTEDLPVMIENKLHALRSESLRAVARLFKTTIAEQSLHLWMEGTHGEGFREMGATVVVLLIKGGHAYAANLGDSRIYRFRKGHLCQLTKDHSVISELIEAGHIEPHEAGDHEAAGQITHYMGMEEDRPPHIKTFTLQKTDRIMLCTDGLTDMVEDNQIAHVLAEEQDPQIACQKLIKKANNAGGHDNTTVIIVDYTSPRSS
jgi:protein phosphatase